jgi:2-succinyl-6-hydroxy-2,4-cyclohexadiene-1-carboxylate synthase
MESPRTKPAHVSIRNPVLILGGFASTTLDFDPLIQEMKSWCSPICVLLPQGDIKRVQEKIFHFLETFSLGAIPVIGYSMGGRIALELARTTPQLFQKVICLSSRVKLESFDALSRWEFEKKVVEKLSTLSLDRFFEWWYSLPLFGGFVPSKKSIEAKIALGTSALLEQFQNLSILNQKPFYAPFVQPIHLIYGKKDPLFLEMQYCFKESLQPIFLHNLDESGHLVHLEQPCHLARLLKKVLE